ncbi:MAG: putative pyridine nucleotide-disulfide oxidoreductase [Thermoleophilia bacterium]|nr:putative pyridine nucleotide-disulfide oxidoreductase [Thermoleophilia bacterium]
MTDETYDVIVVGGGPGGEACSVAVTKAGGTAAMVERDLVGGECPYWGCMPSKALLRPPQALAEAQRTPGALESLGSVLDLDAVLARRDEVVRGLDDSSHADRVAKHGVEIVRGDGRLDGERRVVVRMPDGSERTLQARRAVVIATGTRAAMPPIDGLAESNPWTNREATLVQDVPESLAVLGGGVIGVELAQAFSAFGAKVTVLEGSDRLIPREEPEASALVREALERTGVTVRCGHSVTRVERDGDDAPFTIHLEEGEPVTAERLLVAVGRTGNIEGLGLESVGVEPARGQTVTTTDCMRVGEHDWLYAVGDITGRAQLTHSAVYQAKVAARNAMGVETHCVEDEYAAPRVVFTEPNVCGIGHTTASAEAAGLRVRTYDRDPQRVAAGSFYGRGTEGFARLVVSEDDGCILGATFVGSDIAELLHSATIAIIGRVPLERLRHCVPAFPTRSEVWSRFVDAMDADERERVPSPS